MKEIKIEPISANENVLFALGRKVGAGSELTLAENCMALGAAAQVTKNNYGPGPAEMEVKQLELPESVKGILAEYSS